MNGLSEKIIRDALSEVYDPELHLDIQSMGLVYKIKISDENDVTIIMTLTTPACPYGPMLVADVEEAVKKLKGVRNVNVEITFDPPWSLDNIDPDIRATLNL